MKFDSQNLLHLENPDKMQGLPEAHFPIIEVEEEVLDVLDDDKNLREGQIAHFIQVVGSRFEKKHRFVLLKTVGSLHYIFSLSESSYAPKGQMYSLNFKTQEYEYAVTDLSDDQRLELVKIIAEFVNTVSNYLNNSFSEISVSPADASYTSQEINECIEEILVSPQNKLSKKELMSRYKGYEVFDLYYKFFGKNFHETHYNRKSRSMARSRLFKTAAKKYFPEWELIQHTGLGSEFILRRKNIKTTSVG